MYNKSKGNFQHKESVIRIVIILIALVSCTDKNDNNNSNLAATGHRPGVDTEAFSMFMVPENISDPLWKHQYEQLFILTDKDNKLEVTNPALANLLKENTRKDILPLHREMKVNPKARLRVVKCTQDLLTRGGYHTNNDDPSKIPNSKCLAGKYIDASSSSLAEQYAVTMEEPDFSENENNFFKNEIDAWLAKYESDDDAFNFFVDNGGGDGLVARAVGNSIRLLTLNKEVRQCYLEQLVKTEEYENKFKRIPARGILTQKLKNDIGAGIDAGNYNVFQVARAYLNGPEYACNTDFRPWLNRTCDNHYSLYSMTNYMDGDSIEFAKNLLKEQGGYVHAKAYHDRFLLGKRLSYDHFELQEGIIKEFELINTREWQDYFANDGSVKLDTADKYEQWLEVNKFTKEECDFGGEEDEDELKYDCFLHSSRLDKFLKFTSGTERNLENHILSNGTKNVDLASLTEEEAEKEKYRRLFVAAIYLAKASKLEPLKFVENLESTDDTKPTCTQVAEYQFGEENARYQYSHRSENLKVTPGSSLTPLPKNIAIKVGSNTYIDGDKISGFGAESSSCKDPKATYNSCGIKWAGSELANGRYSDIRVTLQKSLNNYSRNKYTFSKIPVAKLASNPTILSFSTVAELKLWIASVMGFSYSYFSDNMALYLEGKIKGTTDWELLSSHRLDTVNQEIWNNTPPKLVADTGFERNLVPGSWLKPVSFTASDREGINFKYNYQLLDAACDSNNFKVDQTETQGGKYKHLVITPKFSLLKNSMEECKFEVEVVEESQLQISNSPDTLIKDLKKSKKFVVKFIIPHQSRNLVSVGGTNACAIDLDDEVRTPYCWGDKHNNIVPIPEGKKNAMSIVNGRTYACMLNHNGEITCWGANARDFNWGGVTERTKYVSIIGNEKVVCGYRKNGTAKCFFEETNPTVDADLSRFLIMTKLDGIHDIDRIALRYEGVAVTKNSGEKIYIEKDTIVTSDIPHMAAPSSSCTIIEGKVSCQGDNSYNQFGFSGMQALAVATGGAGFTFDSNLLQPVRFSCAIFVNRKVSCVGDLVNDYSQLEVPSQIKGE